MPFLRVEFIDVCKALEFINGPAREAVVLAKRRELLTFDSATEELNAATALITEPVCHFVSLSSSSFVRQILLLSAARMLSPMHSRKLNSAVDLSWIYLSFSLYWALQGIMLVASAIKSVTLKILFFVMSSTYIHGESFTVPPVALNNIS